MSTHCNMILTVHSSRDIFVFHLISYWNFDFVNILVPDNNDMFHLSVAHTPLDML